MGSQRLRSRPLITTSFTVTSQRSKFRCCEVIGLAGELDFATAPHLEAVLDRVMVIPKHIIVDLSQLSFIDATGLHLLVRASNLVEGRIWLKGASRHISRVIDVLGLSELFCLEQDPVLAHRAIGGVEPGRQQSHRPPFTSSGSGIGRLPKVRRDHNPATPKPPDPLRPGGFPFHS